MLLINAGKKPSVVAAATTWNNSDKSSSNLFLSNSNRTVSYTPTDNTSEGIRSIATNTASQLVYIEHVIGSLATFFMLGFSVAAGQLNPNAPFVTPTLSFGISNSGQFWCRDSATDDGSSAIATFTNGDRIGIAYNTATQKVWARKNGGAWNSAAAGTQDPATGQGGFTVVLTGSPFYAFAGLDANTGDAFTTNFASSDWVDAAPSGFSQLSA